MDKGGVLSVLRGYTGRVEASLWDFSPTERDSALSALSAVRAVWADEIAHQRGEFLQSLHEVEEPYGHIVAFRKGSENAEQVVRGS